MTIDTITDTLEIQPPTHQSTEVRETLEQYQEGAAQLLAQLRDWEIGSEEAQKLERKAHMMWYDDCKNLGIRRVEARELWREYITQSILANDPAFDE